MEIGSVRIKGWVLITVLLAGLNALLIMGIVVPKAAQLFDGEPADGPAYMVELGDVPATSIEQSEEQDGEMKQYAVYLEWKLTDSWVEGDYQIEEYRQFEVYKDGTRVVETVATPDYQYLRYWIGE